MPRVVRSTAALRDLAEIAHYIGVQQQSSESARRLIQAVEEKCRLYAAHPELGERRPDLGENLRLFLCGTPSQPRNFVVIYRPIEDGIEVVRIFRGSRDYPSLF